MNLCLKTLPKTTPLSPKVYIAYIGPPRNALVSVVAQSPYYIAHTYICPGYHTTSTQSSEKYLDAIYNLFLHLSGAIFTKHVLKPFKA